MSNRFVDNVTILDAETLNTLESDLGAKLNVSGGAIQLQNTKGETKSSIELPQATQNIRGGVKIWISGTTLNISTQ